MNPTSQPSREKFKFSTEEVLLSKAELYEFLWTQCMASLPGQDSVHAYFLK
jgi:hypothetical protein